MKSKIMEGMAKRFISTDLIGEDWYVELPNDMKVFFIYATLKCDHAGFLRVNLRVFNALHGTDLEPAQIMEALNEEKQRIREISDRMWFLEDFIPFQYGEYLNPKNRLHLSILNLLEKHGVSLSSIKGLNSSLYGVKEKEKDKEKDINTDSKKKRVEVSDIPTVSEISSCMESWLTAQGISPESFDIDELPQKFHDHYASQGWLRSNGMPIRKWQPLVSQWMMREKSRILKEINKGTVSAEMNTPKTEKKWHKRKN